MSRKAFLSKTSLCQRFLLLPPNKRSQQVRTGMRDTFCLVSNYQRWNHANSIIHVQRTDERISRPSATFEWKNRTCAEWMSRSLQQIHIYDMSVVHYTLHPNKTGTSDLWFPPPWNPHEVNIVGSNKLTPKGCICFLMRPWAVVFKC